MPEVPLQVFEYLWVLRSADCFVEQERFRAMRLSKSFRRIGSQFVD